MLKISTTTQFEKDLKKAAKQGKNADNIFYIMERLANEESLEEKYRNHRLKGIFVGRWECHIEPDLLLVYFKADKEIRFERIGLHSELFK